MYLGKVLKDAKERFAALPEHRQKMLLQKFQEASDAARFHSQYSR